MRCRRRLRLQPEYNVVREGGDRGKRKKEEYILSTVEPVYNFISRRPGAPRRDRRHAHLCVSWAPAQVASPFAAPQRLMLLLLPPLLSLPLFLARGLRLCVGSSPVGLFAPDKSPEEWPFGIGRVFFPIIFN